MSGTLESSGMNTTAVPERDPVNLGFTNIGNNAKAGQGARGSVGVGINKVPGPGSTEDVSESTSDTQTMAFPSGTVESQGING